MTRRNHYDVTNRICVASVSAVRDEVIALLQRVHPDVASGAVANAFDLYARLHAGLLPGYVGTDTPYHDAQHSLDVALATARLIDGHEQTANGDHKLGARRAVLGVIVALFHDAGYVRRTTDRAGNGAEYTLSHVTRSAEFLGAWLPTLAAPPRSADAGKDGSNTDLANDAALAMKLVHFTGYEVPLDDIDVHDPLDRKLAFMIGTADLLAQTADRCYLEKCRDFLWPEFEIAGLVGASTIEGRVPVYSSREALMRGTPEFNATIWAQRLDGYFAGVHRHLGTHFSGRFGGPNPYVDCIAENLERIRAAIRTDDFSQLQRRPQVVGRAEIRQQIEQPTLMALAA